MKPGTGEEAMLLDPTAGEWMRLLFEAIDDAIIVHDLEGRILEANPATTRRLGYSREELLQMTTADIDDPAFAAEFSDRLQKQLSNKRLHCEGRHRTKDGRVIAVDINTSVIPNAGRPLVLAVMRDISQRKAAEEAQSRQNELLVSILNNLGDAVLVVDQDRKVLSYNNTAQKLFGLPPVTQMRGQPLPSLPIFSTDQTTPIPEASRPLARAFLGDELNGLEVFIDTAEGSPDSAPGRWYNVKSQPLRVNGNIEGGVLVFRDITERFRNRARQQVQYAVAHALASGFELEEALADILRVIGEKFGFQHAAIWVLNPQEQMLHCLISWQSDTSRPSEFATMTRRISFHPGYGLPGRVLAKGTPIHIVNAEADRGQFPRVAVAAREGLVSAQGFPIRSGGETIGVIELFSKQPLHVDDALDSLMTALGQQIGQLMERHRVEKALRNSEALYHSLVESLPQNIFRKNRAGRITFANQRYCTTLKLPLGDLLGKGDYDLFPPELAAKYVADDKRVMETGETLETIEEHVPPTGEQFYVQVVKTPTYDASGNIIGTQGIFWDVTERVRAQKELAVSEHRYRQLAEASLDGIIVVDQQQKIVLFNPAAENMFGYSPDEVLEHDVSMLIPEEYREAHDQGFKRFLETRKHEIIGQTIELQGLHKDGSIFPIEIALTVFSVGRAGSDGKTPVRFLGAIRDLTERNKMRSVLVQNEKLASIGLLSAGVAHEINNPLAFVGNNLAVLERDCQSLLALVGVYGKLGDRLHALDSALAARVAELIEEMDLEYLQTSLPRLLNRTREGVDRVTRIVHSLRGLARTDAPKMRETRLSDLVDNNIEILRGRLRKNNIAIEQEHDSQPIVACVASQISQVLLNLFINAVQAIEATGRQDGLVRIKTRRQGQFMVIEISDNGPGIPQDHLSVLFDPFFTTKDVGEGTGLGLSISHNIVTGHGGRIEVDSKMGAGATFRIFLPLHSGGKK